MPANVVETKVEMWNDTLGRPLTEPRKTTGYTAWCDECVGEAGVNWRGRTWPVGYVSAPAFEAVGDAEEHNERHDPTHIVRVSELEPEGAGVMRDCDKCDGGGIPGGSRWACVCGESKPSEPESA